MKKIFLLVPVFSLLMITGCSKHDSDNAVDSKEQIRLKVNIGAITRGDGAINGNAGIPDNGLPVKIIRLDKDETFIREEGEEPIFDGTISKEGILTFNDPVLGDGYYPADKNQEFRLICWYPDMAYSKGIITGGNFDGSQEVLVTTLLKGSRNNPFPDIEFHHVFSQLIVEVAARDQDAIDRWGALQNVIVKSKWKPFTLDLNQADEFTLPKLELSTAEQGGTIPLMKQNPLTKTPLFDYNGENPLTLPNLSAVPSVEPTLLGYTIFPAAADEEGEELELELVTTLRGATTIKMPKQKYEGGKSYTLTVTFANYLILELSNEDGIINSWTPDDPLSAIPLAYPNYIQLQPNHDPNGALEK